MIRAIVFGLCSLIIPAGYNNDPYFYQCPNQSLSTTSTREAEGTPAEKVVVRCGEDDEDEATGGPGGDGGEARGSISNSPSKRQTLFDDVESEAFSGMVQFSGWRKGFQKDWQWNALFCAGNFATKLGSFFPRSSFRPRPIFHDRE